MGWIGDDKDVNDLKYIKDAGCDLGICYHIINDLKDKSRDKSNICMYFTHNEIIDIFTERMLNFSSIVSKHKLWNNTLKELNMYMIETFKQKIN